MILLGLVSWILLEYLFHRFLHFGGIEAHQQHHLNPQNKDNLFIKWYIVAIVSLTYCLVFSFFLSLLLVFWLYLGFAIGYLFYEGVHYTVHYSNTKWKILKYLRKHHLRHHYKNKDGNYSVVFPPLDTLFKSKI